MEEVAICAQYEEEARVGRQKKGSFDSDSAKRLKLAYGAP